MNRTRLTRALTALALGIVLSATAACSGSHQDGAARSAAPVADRIPAEASHRTAPDPYAYLPKVPSFTLSSRTVRDGHPLPTAQLSGIFKVPGGKDVSPQLSWSGFPRATKSFVVTMYDPEAPTGSGFWHWLVADIPATTVSLPANAGTPAAKLLPAGALQLPGDANANRYIGGAPPANSGIHDYYLTVTALDIPKTGLPPTTTGALLGFTIAGHTLARATLVCPTAAS